ncbi:MAG: glycosyltransferase family 9 protein, partial [Candidatus Auribacterota bacterium]|nr:glycosyltransferase family 9 protein [Candidatus Auribacterota bacterium]
GGPDEKEEADEFFVAFEGTPGLINLVGKLSIPETIATLQLSSLLITNDSGLLHWAIAIDTPTVSFFGPETPDLYGPEDRDRHIVFYSARYCSPCLTSTYAKVSYCSDNLCLRDISVPEVFDAVINILNHGKSHASDK